MIEFLRKIYEYYFEIPKYYMHVESEWWMHAWSIIFIIVTIILPIVLYKQIKDVINIFKAKKERRRKIEKQIVKLLELEKDKNEKLKNY